MGFARLLTQSSLSASKPTITSGHARDIIPHSLFGRHASTTTISRHPLKLVNGKAVLYRGPPAMALWVYLSCGAIFTTVGLTLSYNVYNHFTWPLTWRDPNNPPKLAEEWVRKAIASVAGVAGGATALLFFAVPTRTVTKLTLDTTARELIVRTSARGITAFLPRILVQGPFRKIAQSKGYYRTNRNDERIVPLSSVYRIRGSATEGAINPVKVASRKVGSDYHAKRLDNRMCLEMKIGVERGWYRLETVGGAQPPKGLGYVGFIRRLQHRLRGVTDWDGAKPFDVQLGRKEPWFADRRTFDDILPLIKRR